jgi:hypothetical protein
MAFNYSPTGVYNPRPLDFSALADLPEDFWKGQAVGRQNQMRAELESLPKGPDGTPDLKAAASVLLKYEPARGAQLLQSINNQDALTDYRTESLKPEMLRLYEGMYPQGTPPTQAPAQPMRLGPDGKPTFKEFVDSQKATKDPYTIQSERERAKYNAFVKRKEAQAPNIKAGLRNLKSYADTVDDTSFANAVGPLQGAQPDDIVTRELARAARVGGELLNKFEGGATAPTEIRNQIGGSAQALSAAIKPLIRAPGEGIWTDKDQELLDRVVGNLSESRSKAEYYRRLQGVANRIQDNFGLDLSGWDAKEGSHAAGAVGSSLPQGWGNANAGGAYDAASDPGNESPYPEAGPTPPRDVLELLEKNQADPEFRAIFEGEFGKGSVDRWLNNDGWTGR